MTNLRWSFYQVWNKSLETRPDKEIKPRDYIWATDLGGAMIDRYFKMKGITPSNPPNARALRKFEAGNLMEWVVELVLKRAGILIDKQKWCDFQYPNLLRTTGRLDHLVGGKPDWGKAKAEVGALGLPEFFDRATDAIIDYFAKTFPGGLAEVVLETKSSSSFKFDRYDAVGPDLNHKLQVFHYLKATGLEEGHLVYFCKDDLRMIEFGIFNTPTNPTEIEEIYRHDIETITQYYQRGIEPPKEPEVLFDNELFKFNTNWKVEYSSFLTKIYGYSEPESYREKWDRKVAQFNRTFGRVVTGKNMTDLNKQVIEEATALFPEFNDFVALAKEKAKSSPELAAELVSESGGNDGN